MRITDEKFGNGRAEVAIERGRVYNDSIYISAYGTGHYPRTQLIAVLKAAGITADDFRERTAQDIVKALPVGAVFIRHRNLRYGEMVEHDSTVVKIGEDAYTITNPRNPANMGRVSTLFNLFVTERPGTDVTVIYPKGD